MSDQHVAKLLSLTEEVTFGEDEVIFPAGKPSAYLYLLTSGCVCVEARTAVYRLCVQVVGPGGAFGWSSLLGDHETVFQVRAIGSSTALRVEAKKLLAECRQDPEFGWEVMRRVLELVAERIVALEARLADFCGLGVRSKPGAIGEGRPNSS